MQPKPQAAQYASAGLFSGSVSMQSSLTENVSSISALSEPAPHLQQPARQLAVIHEQLTCFLMDKLFRAMFLSHIQLSNLKLYKTKS